MKNKKTNTWQLSTRTVQITTLAVTLSGSLLLSACGSSSSSSAPPSQPATKDVSVSGAAAKGILKGAKVELCTNTSCEGEENPVAVGATKENGSYDIKMPASGSQVMITRISYQSGAKMVCDIPTGCDGVGFGDWTGMPEDLVLRSMATVEPSSTTVLSNVTPLTELSTFAAEQSMQGIGKLSAEAMNNGYAAVRQMLGLGDGGNLNLVKPLDVTKESAKTDDEALVSLLSASFAEGDVSENLNAFTEAIAQKSISKKKIDGMFDLAKAIAQKSPSLKSSVSKLESKKLETTKECEQDCSIEIKPSTVPDEALNQLSQNHKATKQLVEDVRTLGWEIYPDLEKALKNEEPDAASLIGQIDNASDIFSKDFVVFAEGLTDVSSLLTLAIVNANKLDDEIEIDNNTTLQDLARVYFESENQWKLDNWEWDGEWCQEEDDDDTWKENYCDEYVWDEDTLAEKTEDYAKQFSDTKITRSNNGETWQLKNATFTKQGENASVNIDSIVATLPNVANQDSIKDISATFKAKASYNEITAEISNANLNIKQTAALNLREENLDLCVDEASLKADAIITYKGDRSFEGKVNVTGGTNPTIRGKNGIEQQCHGVAALLPKSASVEGRFSGNDSVFLEAKLTADLHNFDTYWYNAKGAESNVPVTLDVVNDNSIKVQIGADSAVNRLSYTLNMRNKQWTEKNASCGYVTNEEGYDEWVCEDREHKASLITIDDCEAKGNARCPALSEWDGIYVGYDQETQENIIIPGVYLATWDNEESEYKHHEFSSIIDMLNGIKDEHEHEYRGTWTWSWEYWQLFGQARLTDPQEGYISLDDDRHSVIDLETLTAEGKLNTFARRNDNVLQDDEDNFINATVTAELTSKIANDLPETNIKLTAKRHEFDKARIDLTLGWDKGEGRRSITLSALSEGRSEEQVAQNLRFLIADHSGTSFNLKPANDGNRVGTITKDGTTYATITKENLVHIVTYHYNDKGERQDSNSEEFESLF